MRQEKRIHTLTKISSLFVPEIVILTSSKAVSGTKFVNMAFAVMMSDTATDQNFVKITFPKTTIFVTTSVENVHMAICPFQCIWHFCYWPTHRGQVTYTCVYDQGYHWFSN